MTAYINIGTNTRQNARVRNTIDQLQRYVNELDNIKAMFDQIALGGDFAALGTLLGVSAADAETVYNLWGSANAEVKAASFLTQLLSRCG